MQGLIKAFKPELEARLKDPDSFDAEAHFQKAWSGEPFANKDWADKFGGGKTYIQ